MHSIPKRSSLSLNLIMKYLSRNIKLLNIELNSTSTEVTLSFMNELRSDCRK